MYVLQHGGQVLVRANLTNLPLADEAGLPFPLLNKLNTLTHAPWVDREVRVP